MIRAAALLILLAAPARSQTCQRVGCIITASATVDFYGSLATPATVSSFKTAIEKCWNGFKLGCCDVKVAVEARGFPEASTSLGTEGGGWDIELKSPPYRSYVRPLTRSGTWEATMWDGCHEFGHILGLPDDYSEPLLGGPTTPNPGHAGHGMASYGAPITQHEVEDMVKGYGHSCPEGCCPAHTTTSVEELQAENALTGG